ncbi:MAG: tetratricopeptide repeat protein [Pseudomonadota bacterium]
MKISHAILTFFVCAMIISAGCAGSNSKSTSYANGATWSTSQLVAKAQDAAYDSMKSENRRISKELAEKGMEYAETCLMKAPEEAGCYYWRAVNTGLYYKIHVIGYQDGIKKMLADCNKVISLSPKYDHAGAYRMMGEIYTQLPQTAGRPDSITRNVELAEEYLRKAVRLAPDYPENHLALAEALLAQGKIADALEALSSAKDLTPQWRTDVSYNDWRDTTFALEKKLAKAK